MSVIKFDVQLRKVHGVFYHGPDTPTVPHNKGIIDLDKKSLIFYNDENPQFCVSYNLNIRTNADESAAYFITNTCDDGELCIKDDRYESTKQFGIMNLSGHYNMLHAKPLSISYDKFIAHLKEAMQPPPVEMTLVNFQGHTLLIETETLKYLKSQGISAENIIEGSESAKALLEYNSITEQKIKTVKSLLLNGKLNDKEISEAVGISLDKVQEIKDGKHDNISDRIEELK